jgi:hypothetical protein
MYLIANSRALIGVAVRSFLELIPISPNEFARASLSTWGTSILPAMITGTRPFHDRLLVTLRGFHSREEVAELTNLQFL